MYPARGKRLIVVEPFTTESETLRFEWNTLLRGDHVFEGPDIIERVHMERDGFASYLRNSQRNCIPTKEAEGGRARLTGFGEYLHGLFVRELSLKP